MPYYYVKEMSRKPRISGCLTSVNTKVAKCNNLHQAQSAEQAL
ncbi:MAG: hypothetical protein ACI8QD_002928 [Cyclobacteriaceae bacterium]|jgi:hypothetical protein